jgi:hypothetical protein
LHFGDFELDETGKVAKKRKWLFGHVVKAVGDKRYEVLFDNGLVKECSSYILSVTALMSSVPPDMPIPNPQNEREEDEMANVGKYIVDQQEDEDIPCLPPKAEDAEAEIDENGGDANDNQNAANGENQEKDANQPEHHPIGTENVIHDPNGRMPGQLSRGAYVPRDYASVKGLAKEKVASLIGKTVTVAMKRITYSVTWKVIESHIPDMLLKEKEPTRNYGIKDFYFAIEKNKQRTRPFTEQDFLIGLGIHNKPSGGGQASAYSLPKLMSRTRYVSII